MPSSCLQYHAPQEAEPGKGQEVVRKELPLAKATIEIFKLGSHEKPVDL